MRQTYLGTDVYSYNTADDDRDLMDKKTSKPRLRHSFQASCRIYICERVSAEPWGSAIKSC